jgi:hypothetical protein
MTHTREFVQKIYDVFEETNSKTVTAQRLGVPLTTVKRWLKNPALNDPYLDMVAVERALLGERKVFAALTRWEEDEVFSRVREIVDAFGPNNIDRTRIFQMYVDSWGISNEALSNRLEKIRLRDARAGAAA